MTDVDSDNFLVKQNGQLLVTPLLLALILVEISDIVFAIDSIPAIFAITDDPFIVFTSNIFAILGMRALYSLVADLLGRLRFLHIGLAFVLAFVGGKMLLAPIFKVPVMVSLAVIIGLIAGSALISMLVPDRSRRAVRDKVSS